MNTGIPWIGLDSESGGEESGRWLSFVHSPSYSWRQRVRRWLMVLKANGGPALLDTAKLVAAILAGVLASWGYLEFHGATQIAMDMPQGLLEERARPDPWTGTQGRETREMVRSQSEKIDKKFVELGTRLSWLDEHGTRALGVLSTRVDSIEASHRLLIGRFDSIQADISDLKADVRVILSVLRTREKTPDDTGEKH